MATRLQLNTMGATARVSIPCSAAPISREQTMQLSKKASITRQLRFRLRLAAFVILLNVLICGLAAWVLHQSRLNYQKEAEKETQNVSRVMAQSLADTIKKIEMTLLAVDEEFIRQRATGRLDDSAMNAFLTRHHARFPEMGSIWVINASGNPTHGTRKILANGFNVADRDYFKHLRSQTDIGTYTSKPYVGRTTGEWTLGFARRISIPDGNFGGVVLGTIEVSRIEAQFSAVNLGKGGVIAIRDSDFGLVARHPRPDKLQSMANRKAPPLLSDEFIRNKGEHGMFFEKSPVDDIVRVASVRKIGSYPLYLVVGLAENDYLVKWWREALTVCGVLGAFLLVTVLMSVQLDTSFARRNRLIEKLDRKQRRFHTLAAMSADWFWEQDENYRFVRASKELAERRFAPDDLVGKARWDFDTDKTEDEWIAHRALLEARQPFYNFEYCITDDAGKRRCISVSGEPVLDESGRFVGYQGVGRDITEKRHLDERIKQMAQYDTLTKLPNRALFNDRLSHAISMANRDHRQFALLYFDLDRFKPVNDRYGHDAGDQLLLMVAARVGYLLRESDTIARIGGDEFVVLLPVIASHKDAEEVANRIISALTSPYTLGGIAEKITVGVSIGIALYPKDGTDRDSLIKSADAAMYKSKCVGNCYFFHEATANGMVRADS